ncbi:MAG: hypothetical protein WCJ03_02290 [Bacteroidales bacterium]
MKLKREFGIAFRNYYNWIGYILAAISIYQIVVAGFDIGIAKSINMILQGYKFIFYNIFDFLFSWINIDIPSWCKDIASIYIIISLAILRTTRPSFIWLNKFLKRHRMTNTRIREVFFFKPPIATNRFLYYLISILLWPIVFIRILKTPYFSSNDAMGFPDSSGNLLPVFELYEKNEREIIDFGKFGFDARKLFLSQLLITIVIFLIISMINGGLKSYT